MHLTKQELDEFEEIIKKYKEHHAVQLMKQFMQHGSVSTYEHCEDVARHCFWLNRRLHLNANEEDLVIAALLHDFFLYDWHYNTPESQGHATGHAEKARKNAVKYFNVNKKVQKIISGHMWPVNITKVPTDREAAILVIIDKYCSLRETLFKRKKRK